MVLLTRALAFCALSSAAFGLAACAGQGPIAARVDGSAISQAEVDHWTSAIAAGATAANGLGQSGGEHGRQAALEFLISARWLAGEAAARGMAVSAQAVERTLRERIEPEGEDEFQRGLKRSGRTVADAKLEIEAELAAEVIRRVLARRAARITPQEVRAYYRRNALRLGLPERRVTDALEEIPSRAAAVALLKRVGTGPGFTKLALHEGLKYRLYPEEPEKSAVLVWVFKARPGDVSGPMKYNKRWALFIVRRIIPPEALPLASVRTKAIAGLIAERQRALAAEYLKSYRGRWLARTSCSAGYVVQGCRQYAGPVRPEPNPFGR
jgi:parvulin-like peptidyl-prolyl isomerase